MTEQYQEESINGQPAPLSVSMFVPTAPPVPGGVDDAAIFWPSFALDATFIGDGITVAGGAANGTILEISKPGVFTIETAISTGLGAGSPMMILRGTTLLPVSTANFYPSFGFTTPVGAGTIAGGSLTGPPISLYLSNTFRITLDDLVDSPIGPNPNRQLRFSVTTASIIGLLPDFTSVVLTRVSR